MKKFLCPIFVAIMSSEALAGSYAIKLRGFGFNRADCDGDLALVAEAFGVGADVEILSAGCAAPEIGENAPSGIFTYASPTRIATSSSDVRQSSRVDGHYDSFASCESARQSEWGIFARVTGLSPYVSYCYQANSVGAPRYRVRIDAVGTSQTKKQSISASWMHRLDDERKLVGDVQNLVTSVGGEVIAATVDRDIAGFAVGVDFYHEQEFYLHAQEMLYWQSLEHCQASVSSLAQQWNEQSTPSTFQCTHAHGDSSQLVQVYLSNNVLSGFATKYATEEACLQDGVRIRSALERSGSKVLGTVCGQQRDLKGWQLVTFTKKI